MDYLEQIQLVVRGGFELGISRFQVQCPNHSATLPVLESLFVANTVKLKLIVTFQLLKLHTAAKIEEETKKGQSLTDPTVKENNESASSTEQGEKSPSKRHHHSRKDHSLKIKLPSPEKRKRRLRRSRDEIFEVTGYFLVAFS